MALNKTTLKDMIISNLEALGIVTTGTHAKSHIMAQAVADAVVDHITAAAEVQTTSGAPDGEHAGIIT